jgi:hypothetical protein
MNPDIDTGQEDVWAAGGTRLLPTAAATCSVVSTSANDDGDPVGTGARTVTIEGLDANYDEITETVTMNGVGAVTTVQSFLRVNTASVATAGSAETNVGNISISIGGNIQAYIEDTEGHAHLALYTVPRNHTWFVTEYILTTGRQSATADLQFLGQVKHGGVWHSIEDHFLYQSVYINSGFVQVIEETQEFRVRAASNTDSLVGAACVAGYLVNNDHL